MRPPKLRPIKIGSRVGRRVMAFRIFSNNDRPPFWILKILIFNHVTVIAVLTCCCVPNFIEIGSRVRPPDAHNCRMSNAPLTVAMATASWRTCRGHDGMWPPKLRPSRSIGRRVMAFRIYFQHGGRPPFWILKILIFDLMTVIAVLTCCCIPNFIKIGSRFSMRRC